MVIHEVKGTKEVALVWHLEIRKDGGLSLFCRRSNETTQWHVLQISKEGKLRKTELLASDLGLKLDKEGRIEDE